MGNTFQGVLLMPKVIDDIKACKYYEVFLEYISIVQASLQTRHSEKLVRIMIKWSKYNNILEWAI